MPTVPIHHVGRVGIIKDRPAHELPPEAWSDGANVRFHNDVAEKMDGSEAAFDPPSVTPYWVMWAPGLTESYWIYAGANAVYVVSQAGVHTVITRASGGAYAMDTDLLWNGGILGGIPIINNGVDTPQRWATIDSSVLLDDLPNWPANTSARIVRPFGPYLVALDITVSGVRSPHKVKWSHPADPGSVPSSWDETDPTKDAGEFELTDAGRGFIVDGLQLGDAFAIYKQSSIWALQVSGGRFIFRNFRLFDGFGAFSKHCVAHVGAKGPARHFVFTGDDVIVHDGRSAQSVLEARVADWLLNNLDGDNLNRAFCLPSYPTKENLFCFPTPGNTWPNMALIWNWESNTITFRDLEPASFIGIGNVEDSSVGSVTWDGSSGTWDGSSADWGGSGLRPTEQRMLQADPTNGKLRRLERTNQLSGQNMTTYLERTGLAIAGVDRNRQPVVDYSIRKLATRIWPRVEGGPINVRMGSQEDIDDAVVWADPQTFDPATDKYLDFEVGGRLIAVRFESGTNVSWKLAGYDVEVEALGRL